MEEKKFLSYAKTLVDKLKAEGQFDEGTNISLDYEDLINEIAIKFMDNFNNTGSSFVTDDEIDECMENVARKQAYEIIEEMIADGDLVAIGMNEDGDIVYGEPKASN